MISAAQLEPLASAPEAPCLPYALRLCFAGVAVELCSTEQALIDALRHKFRYHLTGAAPEFQYFVWPTPTGYRFWCSHEGGWQWNSGILPSDALAFLTDAALCAAVIHARPELRSIHAAALALDGAGAIIAGESTAGKTTTLLACARAGAQVFSDERALLCGGTLQPFVRTCTVRSGGRALLLRDDRFDTLGARLRGASEIDLIECFGKEIIAAPVPLRAVFVLGGPGERAVAQPLEPPHALPAISRWLDMCARPVERLAEGLALLQERLCYRLTLGTPAATAAVILDAMAAAR